MSKDGKTPRYSEAGLFPELPGKGNNTFDAPYNLLPTEGITLEQYRRTGGVPLRDEIQAYDIKHAEEEGWIPDSEPPLMPFIS